MWARALRAADYHCAILPSCCSLTVLNAQSGRNLASLALPPRNLPQGKHNLLCLLEKGQAGLSSNPSSVAVKLCSLKGHFPFLQTSVLASVKWVYLRVMVMDLER